VAARYTLLVHRERVAARCTLVHRERGGCLGATPIPYYIGCVPRSHLHPVLLRVYP